MAKQIEIIAGRYVAPVLYRWGIYDATTGERYALYNTREAAEADLQRYATQKAREGVS